MKILGHNIQLGYGTFAKTPDGVTSREIEAYPLLLYIKNIMKDGICAKLIKTFHFLCYI